MKVTELSLPGVKLIEPTYFEDYRGYYCESYSSRTLHEFSIEDNFVQDNHFLCLTRGTIRGIHFQNDPYAQSKLIRCTRGSLFDVAVDLRKGSPTYKKWVSVILSAQNRKQLYIPKGYGHICMSLVDNTEGQYKVDKLYAPAYDRAIAWNDPEIGIEWPPIDPIVSVKDQKAPTLAESDVNFQYEALKKATDHSRKTAVITGVGGFIGKALARKMLSIGWRVVGVDRSIDLMQSIQDETDSKWFVPLECDFSHYNELAAKIGCQAEAFLHFAWQGVSGAESVSLTAQAENVLAAADAMEQAQKLGIKRFLFAGSSYQYRMEQAEESGERSFERRNLYGLAKASAATLLRTAASRDGMDFNSVMFTNVFGPGDTSRRSTNTMISKLLDGEPLDLIAGDHPHDWTYIDDAVLGIIAVLEHGVAGRDYYIGSRHPRKFKDIITEVRDVLAPDAELRFGALKDESYIDYSSINLDALYQDTGYECCTEFEDGIRKTAKWVSLTSESRGGVQSNSLHLCVLCHPLLLRFFAEGADERRAQ